MAQQIQERQLNFRAGIVMTAALTILNIFFMLALLSLLELPGFNQGIQEDVIFYLGWVAGIVVCEIVDGVFAITKMTWTSGKILTLHLSSILILARALFFVFFDNRSALQKTLAAILTSLRINQIITDTVLLLYVLNIGLRSYNPKRSDSSARQHLVHINLEKL